MRKAQIGFAFTGFPFTGFPFIGFAFTIFIKFTPVCSWQVGTVLGQYSLNSYKNPGTVLTKYESSKYGRKQEISEN